MNALENADSITLVFIGDIHGLWTDDDEQILRQLKHDMTIFVGDISEDGHLCKKIAAGPTPRMVMLGNHDAWTCLTAKRRSSNWGGEHTDGPAALVYEQLEALGDRNLAWNCKAIPGKAVSVVGGRPFSKGGPDWGAVAEFYENVFACSSSRDSTRRTVAALDQAPVSHATVLVGHNGPAGLGSQPHDICGVDFDNGSSEDKDWGDVDLRDALQQCNRTPELVVFGHMHSGLSRSHNSSCERRIMLRKVKGCKTIYLNVAEVPRIRACRSKTGEREHQFTVVQLGLDGRVRTIKRCWFQWAAAACRAVCTAEFDLLRYDEHKLQLWNDAKGTWVDADTSNT